MRYAMLQKKAEMRQNEDSGCCGPLCNVGLNSRNVTIAPPNQVLTPPTPPPLQMPPNAPKQAPPKHAILPRREMIGWHTAIYTCI